MRPGVFVLRSLLALFLCLGLMQAQSSPGWAETGAGTGDVKGLITLVRQQASFFRGKPSPGRTARAEPRIEEDAFSEFVPSMAVPGALKPVLRAFAEKLAKHDWPGLLAFFESDHLDAQLNMYMSDTFMFGWLGKAGNRSVATVIQLYIYETMQFAHQDDSNRITREDIDRIETISYRNLSDSGDYLTLSYVVRLNDGRRTRGEVYIEKDTLKFFGAFG